MSPLTRRCLAAIALAAAVAGAQAQAPRAGGTLTIAATEPTSLLSLTETNTDIRTISAKVTEGLLRYDAQFNPQPLLAVAWSVNAEKTVYRFQLRPNVKWHDGQPFTSADVKYSLLALRDNNPRGRITFANLQRVDTPDALTAVVVLSKPAIYLIRAFSSAEAPIVPAHLYEGRDIATNPANRAPVGTGPFVFERWQRGSHVLLKRNPAYWAAGRPLLDQVVFKFVPDPAAAALETGAVDVAGLLPSDLDRVAKLPQIAVDVRTDGYLNNMETLEFNLDSPYLRNLRVRQAIAHAIDKEFIRKAVFDGRFESLSSPIPKVLSRYYAPAERQYAYDVQEANRLLDAAGFPRKGGGERFALTIYFYPGSASFRATAEYIKAALARVGIRVTVQTADMALLTRRVYTERQFDLNINGVGALYDPTVGVQRHYWSTVHGQRVPFNNASGYANPEVGELFRKVAEEADEDRRAALLRRFQQIVGEEIPLLPLIALQTVSAQNRRVHRYYNSIDLTAGDLSDAWVDEK